MAGMNLSDYLSDRGAAKRLAADLKLSAVTISLWKTGERPVPAERCIDVEKATGGAVRCETLRPDLDWAYLRATGEPAQVAGAA